MSQIIICEADNYKIPIVLAVACNNICKVPGFLLFSGVSR